MDAREAVEKAIDNIEQMHTARKHARIVKRKLQKK